MLCNLYVGTVPKLCILNVSMGKLGELSKFLEYPSSMLENTSQLIWNIPVTFWKFPVGSKMILVFFGIIMTFKNSTN